ncbi:hypothetical protein CRENBAI_001044 [Crenichthys baileyi]|uniref:Uncharacterized protein n=1 Tax=Crenichthys baileyi TaxID=28760 RepID=A0AAV9RNW3_9TELE
MGGSLLSLRIRKEFELPADLLFQRTDGDYWDQGEDWILPEIPTKSEGPTGEHGIKSSSRQPAELLQFQSL